MSEVIIELMENVTLVGAILAFIIFAVLAARSKTVRSFQFQLSLFMLVWVVGEAPHLLDTLEVIDVSPYGPLGLSIHSAAMVLFAFFILYRARRFLGRVRS